MAENSPNLVTSNIINPNKSKPRHIIANLLKIKYKEKYLKISERETTLYLEGKTIRVTVNFLREIMEARSQYDNMFFQC